MPDVSTLLKDFYEFIVHGIVDYLFVFDVHFIIAFIVIIVGIKYTDNLVWYKNLFGKLKEYTLPISGGFIFLGYITESVLSGNITSGFIFSLLQSYMLTIVFQDVFIVLIGLLLNKLSFGAIKFDHNNRSINYVNVIKKNEYIELDKGEKKKNHSSK